MTLMGFKEEAKIKYDSVKAIAGIFPNGTAAMMILVTTETVSLDWDVYCVLPPNNQLAWKEREAMN